MIVQLDEPLFYEGSVRTEMDVDRVGIILPEEDGEPAHVGMVFVAIGGKKVSSQSPFVSEPIDLGDIDDLPGICTHIANTVAYRIREQQEADASELSTTAGEE